jgi:4-carboxymuconolactone decarboxylase
LGRKEVNATTTLFWPAATAGTARSQQRFIPNSPSSASSLDRLEIMMDALEQRREKGRQVLRDMFGEAFLASFEQAAKSNDFGAKAARLALEFAFAETWGDHALDKKYRSMVTMGALIALGRSDELKNHVRAGLNNGLTVAEIEAVILQTLPYVGFPAIAQAQEATMVVLAERGLLGDAKGSKERGLL